MEMSAISSIIYSTYATISSKAAFQAEATEEVQELSDAEKLERFKKEIWDEIDAMPRNSSINFSIQITDKAFERMMKEPEFKERMINAIMNEAVAARSPVTSSMTVIDETGYSGSAYCCGYAEDVFEIHANDKDSFYVRRTQRNGTNINDVWLAWQQERQEQRELLDEKYEKSRCLNTVYKHKADAAKLYEEKTVVNQI